MAYAKFNFLFTDSIPIAVILDLFYFLLFSFLYFVLYFFPFKIFVIVFVYFVS